MFRAPPHASAPTATTPAALRATLAFVLFATGQWLALGLWRAGLSIPSAAWFGLALLALAAGVWRGGRTQSAALGVAVLLLAGGRFGQQILEPDARSLAAALPSGAGPGAIVTLEGVVLERAREVRPAGALAEFVVRGASAGFPLRAARFVVGEEARATGGVVRVTVRGGWPEVRPGEWVRVTGVARCIEGPANPGEGDHRLWARQAGIAGDLEVASPALIEPAPAARTVGAKLERWWLAGRGWLRARAGAVLSGEGGPGRATMGALLLGVSDADTTEVRGAFARQGLAHVLAISGFHLAVMAGAALFAVRLTGDRGRLEPLLVAALVLAYLAILPARAPILRAGAIVLVWLASEALGRRYERRALLAWVAIGVLVVRPMDLFSLGYQLTFGVTAALVWFGERVHERMFPPRLEFRHEPPDMLERRWWLDGATRLVSASVLCWLVATPLVAWATGIVSPTAVLATVVVVPVVTVLLWAGYVALVLGIAAPPAGATASSVIDGIAGWLEGLVAFLDGLPGTTVYVPRLSLALTAALTVLSLWWLVRGRLRSAGTWAATVLVLGWLVLALAGSGRARQGVVLRIDTLAVGDGTCHLVRSGRSALLWDCGSLSPSIGLRLVPRALRELGAWRVPDVVLTHPNFDHYSGLPDVMAQLGVERVWVPPAFFGRVERDPHGAAAECLERVRSRGVEVRALAAGDSLHVGPVAAEVLSPPRDALFAGDNDHSLVARLEARTSGGARRALLCGDIQREAMALLMAPGADLRADVLELPHHGSVHPVALGFVAAVDPRVVLQSTGPSRAAEIRWNELREGRSWWMTAEDGAAWVEIRSDGAIVSGSMRRP